MNAAILHLVENTLWAGVAAVGFAVLFNVPKHRLFLCAIAGAVGYAVRTSLTQFAHADIATATLIASVLVSIFGLVAGRRWHAPPVVFVIPGVIPLIPGSLAFRTMIDILVLTTGSAQVNETVLIEAIANGFKTLLTVGAIAGGIAVPSLLLRRHRPMM